MSESRRNRRQIKDPKRPIILAKKEDKDDKSTPKILLKLKEKEKTPSQPQISIAARPVNADVNAGTSNSTDSGSKSQISGKIQNANSITSKDAKEAKSTSKETPIILTNTNRPTLPRMSRPLPIVSDYYQILNSVQDYLVETNVDFFVIGIVGTQGSGKSTILNFLVDNSLDDYEGGIETINGILKGRAGIFKTRSHTKEAVFSNMPSTEGIQMYITKYRTILLDCSPVLCNPYKKDGILNELDDLKMLIFLLSVCNLLVVVEEPGFNMHLMRLIQTAENMKVDLFEKDLNELRMSPNILICKNKCRNRDFLPESKSRTNNLYKGFFHGSNLKLSAVYANRGMETSSISWNREENMNIFYFPLINDNKHNMFEAYPDLDILLVELRQRVFMSPRNAFPSQNQQSPAFTEKTWFHLALAVWDSHKNNYFLRKYETFKEKEWALRV